MPIYYNKIVVLPLHRDSTQQDDVAVPIDQSYVLCLLYLTQLFLIVDLASMGAYVVVFANITIVE